MSDWDEELQLYLSLAGHHFAGWDIDWVVERLRESGPAWTSADHIEGRPPTPLLNQGTRPAISYGTSSWTILR
jgi:hypothetical protein